MTTTTSNKRLSRKAPERKTAAESDKGAGADNVDAKERPASALPKEPRKIEKVLSLLKRPKGARLDELIGATGWLPHTMRAALAGLKKKGYAVQRTKEDGLSRYLVVGGGSG